jgi:hypothetical protein
MKVVLTIQHPAHVHFFRPIVGELRERGHDTTVFAREKSLTVELLDAFDVEHTVLAREPDSYPGLAATQLRYEMRLFRRARRIRPDVMAAIGGLAVAHVAPLVGAKSVVFTESDGFASHGLVVPFADVMCTPTWFDDDFGRAHRRYDGFHELSYLHPDRFDADPAVLRAAGIEPDSPFFVVRFSEFAAHHDAGQSGFSPSGKRTLVSALREHGHVYVSCEGETPPKFAEFELPVAPEHLHDLLAYANLYVGDTASMAIEAGLLGTPAIRSNSYVGDDDFSVFERLQRAELVESYENEERAIRRAATLARRPDARRLWRAHRRELLAETVDVADYAADVLEDAGERDPGPTATTSRVRQLLAALFEP